MCSYYGLVFAGHKKPNVRILSPGHARDTDGVVLYDVWNSMWTHVAFLCIPRAYDVTVRVNLFESKIVKPTDKPSTITRVI